MIPSGPLFHKPKSIIASRNILYATIFLYIIYCLMGEFNSGLHNFSGNAGITTTITTLVILLLSTRQIGFGHKWARTLFLIFFILQALALPRYLPFIFKSSLALGFLFVLQILLEILALYFLFSKISTNWFNSFKKDTHLAE
jgi:hypothetical protein